MHRIVVTVGPLTAASANNICQSQTPTAAFTINGSLATGGVATLDQQRRVLFTPAGNDTGKTITLTGTDQAGQSITETLAGTNATAFYSVLDYKTVTAISISSAAAGAYTVGTNGVASSPWVNMDPWGMPDCAIQCVVSGTINYTVQQTLDSPNAAAGSVARSAVTWFSHPDPALQGATTSVQSNYAYKPMFARVLVNSNTNPAFVTMTIFQYGLNPA